MSIWCLTSFGQSLSQHILDSQEGRHFVHSKDISSSVELRNLEIDGTYTIYFSSIQMKSLNSFDLVEKEFAEIIEQTDNWIKLRTNANVLRFDISFNETETSTKNSGANISILKHEKSPINAAEKMAGISTSDGWDPFELIRDVFIGGNCFDLAGVVAPGGAGAYGQFTMGLSSINIDEGIMLSTGALAIAHGPNTATGAGSSVGSAGSDPDLSDLIGSNALNDVAIIEFDFTPNEDSVSFDYVFASEEYCDYVNSQFNDVFGFFISGPGINGPFTNNAINLAVVPGSNDYVAINNVNWSENADYYIDNVPVGQPQGAGGCVPDELNNPPYSPNDIQFDGFTTILTAATEVIPCETYHIKLAIADIADGLFDSAVFLRGSSFSAGGGAEVEVGYPDPRFQVAYEGCSTGFFYFERVGNSDLSEPLTINFTILDSSTATADEDYEAFPSSFTIPAGQQGDTLWISVYEDLIFEGQETIVLELDNTCSCTNPTVEIIIDEPDSLTVELDDYFFCNPQGVFLKPEEAGGIPPYTFVWEDGSTEENRFVAPLESETYIVTVYDQCGQEAVDSAVFTIIEQVEASLSGDVTLCESDPSIGGFLQIDFEVGNGPWTFVYSIDDQPYTVFDVTDNPYFLEVTEPGVYELITVSMLDCFGQGDGIVQVDETVIDIGFATTDVLCFDSADGFIDMTASGGVGQMSFEWDNNLGNVEDPMNLLPGVYTVTVTDSLGCANSASAEILSPPEIILDDEILTSVNCLDPNSGSIDIEVSGGQGMLSYVWSHGPMTQDVEGLSEGTYVVTVTDENDCDKSFDFEIEGDFDEPLIELNGDGDITCENDEVYISSQGSDSGDDYSYLWSTEDGNIVSDPTENDIVVNQAGDYTLTITNLVTGCSSEETETVEAITQPPIPEIATPGLLTCEIQVLVLDASSSSDNSHLFEWTTNDGEILSGSDTEMPEIGSTGTYSLVVTDTLTGCTNETEVLVEENILAPIADAGNMMTLTCETLEVILNGNGSNGNDLEYTWSTVDGNIIDGQDSANPTVDQAGTYQLIVRDGINGCLDSAQVVVDEMTMFPEVVLVEPENITCLNTSVFINSTGSSSGPNFTYSWSTQNGNILSTTDEAFIEVGSAGIYTLEIQDLSNDCRASESIEVFENLDTPEADAGPADTLNCSQNILTLNGQDPNASGVFSYQWTSQNGNIVSDATTLNPSIDAPGIYTLEIINTENGCSGSSSVEIFIDDSAPFASIAEPATLNCSNDQIELDASNSSSGPDFSYSWSTTNGNIVSGANSLNLIVDAPGIYTLSILNTENNCIDESSVEVTIDIESPIISIDDPQTINCIATSINLSANIITGNPNYSIQWSTSDGEILNGATSANPEIGAGGTYLLNVVDLENNCSSQATVDVIQDQVIPSLNLAVPGILNCENETVQLSIVGNTDPNTSYEWITSNGNIVSDPNQSNILVDQAGTYTLNIVDINNFCENTQTIEVFDNYDTPNADINNPDTINCLVESSFIQLFNIANNADLDIVWTDPLGNVIDPANPTNFEVTMGGTYNVELTDIESLCSQSLSTEVIEIDNSPSALELLVTQPWCDETVGSVEVIEVIGGTPPYTYSIDGGNNFQSSSIFDQLAPGDYPIIIQDNFGCLYEDYIEIVDIIEVEIDLELEAAISFAEEYQIELFINLPLSEIASIVWDPSEGLSCDDCPNPKASPDKDQLYHVLVTDINGCTDDAVIQIRVDDTPLIYIPNAFTPYNGDNVNDKFFINAKEGHIDEILEMAIFDRWGNRVFHRFDFPPNDPNEGWDGYFRGEPMNPAVFAYMAKIRLADDRIIVLHGDVTLVD